MSLTPDSIRRYHVFLASPGDVTAEREAVRKFFERFNRTVAQNWKVEFRIVDWENYASIGVGRPQELITHQTLDKYAASLALVIGILNQRFGSPTGVAESGTEEEFNWAMEHHREHGTPEIKWFFRKVDQLTIPADPSEIDKAIDQWKKVVAFKERMRSLDDPVFYGEYHTAEGFANVLEEDVQRWLCDPEREWVVNETYSPAQRSPDLTPPRGYYRSVEQAFRRLDIAGIDNDRSFEIPLSDVYVRLRVMFEDGESDEDTQRDADAIDIQTALARYRKLVIVGDPGSGKSTFLKYIALMLTRAIGEGDATLALTKLSLPEPLPLPIFLSCWDLSDFLQGKPKVHGELLLGFIAERLTAFGFPIDAPAVEAQLQSGQCCLLFDGLDEVPTDAGRAHVSRLLEECVEKYGDNRFVVTSRIRAYTGDTILRGEFTRCDIQPFDANDRAEFLRNWVALLTQTDPAGVPTDAGKAGGEYRNLVASIEKSDRIRPLAVNPLLLTVIAIVHWNRKRLPEQRVELYDECVDVLLGQRKEAEHAQITRDTTSLNEQLADQVFEERAWVRKRFAEIALHMLDQDDEKGEASKAELVRLLSPRYLAKGAVDEEQAEARAEQFLQRQELRSGLLVSRRAHSYRFVHLTFQEYLAAWHLSKEDLEEVVDKIEPHLREAKWFETLQLLGSQWAKESDERVDDYVAWLLDRRGDTIEQEAPVVALCANIVRDIQGVAELRPATRANFEQALKNTLDAFRKGSGVPANTQLEILEALGQLGAAVKSYLIDATSASLYPVRARAIEMLLPHLADDELFGMEHILGDRSRVPITAFVDAILSRDTKRSLSLLNDCWPKLPPKAFEGILVSLAFRSGYRADPAVCDILRQTIQQIPYDAPANSQFFAVSAISNLVNHIDPWSFWKSKVREWAVIATDPNATSYAIRLFAIRAADEELASLLLEISIQLKNHPAREVAVGTAMDERTVVGDQLRQALVTISLDAPDAQVRRSAIRVLTSHEDTASLPETVEAKHTFFSKGFAELPTNQERCNLLYQWACYYNWGDQLCRVKGHMFSYEDQGKGVYLDPLLPIGQEQLARVKARFDLSQGQLEQAVSELSDDFGWDIRQGLTQDAE